MSPTSFRQTKPVADFESKRIEAEVRRRLVGGPPTVVGRYEIESKIGGGSGGYVYRAYDPRLRRSVALKVLSLTTAPFLQREAAALAQIAHANIVRVFDVVRADDVAALVMELLDGVTLLQPERLEAPRVLRHYLDIGEGLAAMHRAGLVHRDVKPDNIVVSRGGEAKLLDFGLVRAIGTATPGGEGTPGFAPPEQVRGGSVDPRSDQYAYCQSVRAAVVGTPDESRLRAALERGCASDPQMRWSSMDALLAALQLRVSARRRWGGVAVLGALSVTVVLASVSRDAPDPCAKVAAPRWDPTRRDAIAANIGDDPERAGEVVELVDETVGVWHDVHTRVCDINGGASERQRVCLEDVSRGAERILAMLAEAPTSADEAWAWVSRGAVATQCEDIPLPPRYRRASSEREEALRGRLLDAGVDLRVGEYQDSFHASERVWAEAELLDSCLVSPRAALFAGFASANMGKRAQAEAWFDRALWRSMKCGDQSTVAEAAGRLASLESQRSPGSPRALRFSRQAAVALDVLGWPAALSANHFAALTQLHLQRGEADQGLVAARRGLELIEEAVGADTRPTITFHSNLSSALNATGDMSASMEKSKKALALSIEHHGPDHPSTLMIMGNHAISLATVGKTAEAAALLATAIESRRATSNDPRALLVMLSNLGDLQLSLERWVAAEASLREAAELLGPEPFPLLEVRLYDALAAVLLEQGRLAQAEQALSRSQILAEDAFGRTHIEAVTTRLTLAHLHLRRGQWQEAESVAAEVLLAAGDLEDESLVALAEQALGDVALAHEDYDDAAAHHARAVKHSRAIGMAGDDLAAPLFALAGSQRAAGDEEGALASAREASRAVQDVRHPLVGRIQAFLESTGRAPSAGK